MDKLSSARMPAAWEKAHELRSHAENLDVRTFTALSPGLGLGELRSVVTLTPRAAQVAMRPQAERGQLQVTESAAAPLVDKGGETSLTRPARLHELETRAAGRFRGGLDRRLLAWAVDFLFVTSSLAIALAIATALAASRAKGDVSLLELKPVTWLSQFAPYQILIGVYSVQLLYGLLFRFSVGRTFGESIVIPRGAKHSGWRP